MEMINQQTSNDSVTVQNNLKLPGVGIDTTKKKISLYTCGQVKDE